MIQIFPPSFQFEQNIISKKKRKQKIKVVSQPIVNNKKQRTRLAFGGMNLV